MRTHDTRWSTHNIQCSSVDGPDACASPSNALRLVPSYDRATRTRRLSQLIQRSARSPVMPTFEAPTPCPCGSQTHAVKAWRLTFTHDRGFYAARRARKSCILNTLPRVPAPTSADVVDITGFQDPGPSSNVSLERPTRLQRRLLVRLTAPLLLRCRRRIRSNLTPEILGTFLRVRYHDLISVLSPLIRRMGSRFRRSVAKGRPEG
jgi:hypothetical protein